MKKKQTVRYIVSDTLSAILAWTALFFFRKLVLEESGFEGLGQVFHDTNYWLGIVVVPAGWLTLYTLQDGVPKPDARRHLGLSLCLRPPRFESGGAGIVTTMDEVAVTAEDRRKARK